MKKDLEKKAKQILAGLTSEQKCRLLCGQGAWHTDGLNGKLPQIFMSDGPVGLRTVRVREDGKEETIPAVAFPSVQVLANTWNTERAKEMGAALADECLDRGVDLLLAPGMNIKRHPLNGRNFEYFSEDPELAGRMAKAYVEGVQDGGAGVCIKHFCCNNLEYDRFHQSSEVDERTLREIYYRPFEISCETDPVSLMCSYNRVNGTYASENKKGFDVLRNEFAFDGMIVSDWNAVRDRTAAAKAGLDLEMPYHDGHYEQLAADHKAGKLSDEELDACALRVIEAVLRLKEMNAGKRAKTSEAARTEVSRRIMEEGAVLLKNEGALPIAKGAKVSVCGCYAKPNNLRWLVGGGSACVDWKNGKFDLPAALSARGEDVMYEGAFDPETIWSFGQEARIAAENAALCDVSIVCVGTGASVEYEETDRKTMRLPMHQERAILDAAEQNANTVVIVFAGAAIDMSAWIDRVNAVLYVGFCGMDSDEAIADLLTGAKNPSGKLSETFPLCLEDVPAANTFFTAGVTRYQEGLDVGYRYFDTYGEPVLYPFGHGLSYSAFSYEDLRLRVADGAVYAEYTLRNLSERGGKEVSQIYVRHCAPKVYRPSKELKAFDKRDVAAGSAVNVQIKLAERAFAYWSVSKDRWIVDDGVYEVLVGASVSDIRLRAKVMVKEGKFIIV